MRLVPLLRRGLALALLAGAALATSAPPLTLEQQARKAEVIVQATIGAPISVTENAQSYAVYPLKVSATLAGDAASLPQASGGPALYLLAGVEGQPTFSPGQEALLLLYKGRMDSPIVGFNQGVYLISNGQVSAPAGSKVLEKTQTPAELKAAIVAARVAK